MLIDPYRFGGGGVVVGPYWDANNKHSSITLSGANDRVATFGVADCRAVLGPRRTTGKLYFELVTNTGGTKVYGVAHSLSTFAAASNPGEYGGDYFWYRSNGQAFRGGTYLGLVATWADGDIMGIAIDIDTGKVWASKNGTPVAGNPAAGTGQLTTLTSGQAYPMGSTDGYAGITQTLRLQSGDFSYSPPSGFAEWGAA